MTNCPSRYPNPATPSSLPSSLQSNNYVPLVPTSKGRPLFITRLFEWMVTVPMLLSLIGTSTTPLPPSLPPSLLLTSPSLPPSPPPSAWLVDPDSRRVNQLRGLQFFCLVTGGIGPILRYLPSLPPSLLSSPLSNLPPSYSFPFNWISYCYSCYLQVSPTPLPPSFTPALLVITFPLFNPLPLPPSLHPSRSWSSAPSTGSSKA